jgi:uncharacterized BrkB/YihY/UPF0761 family membrane protein
LGCLNREGNYPIKSTLQLIAFIALLGTIMVIALFALPDARTPTLQTLLGAVAVAAAFIFSRSYDGTGKSPDRMDDEELPE